MKQIFHKIMSIVMAFVVLLSTMSFTVNMHYCGDELVETVIFHKAEGCGMEMENPSTKGCAIIKKKCCNDQQIAVDGQNELHTQVDAVSLEQQVFLASFIYTYTNLFEALEENVSPYAVYEPPLVINQIFKIDESYLI